MLLKPLLVLVLTFFTAAFGNSVASAFSSQLAERGSYNKKRLFQLDSTSLKLKKSLKKRGIKFTDSLIYQKQIVSAKLKTGELQSAFKLNQQLKKQAIVAKNNYFLAQYYVNDALYQKRLRNYGAAAASLFKALNLAEKISSLDELIKYHKVLTNIFFALRDSKKLLYYSQKLRDLEKKQDELHLLSDVHVVLPYIINGNLDEALHMLDSCEKSPKMKVPVYAFSVYLYQSHAYYRKGLYEQSVDRLAKAEIFEKEAETVVPNVSIHRKHGLLLTLVALKQYQRAKEQFERYQEGFVSLMDWDDRREAFEAGSKLYEALGDSKKALRYYKAYEAYKDSVNNLATQKAVNDIEIKYQTSLKEKALADQKVQLIKKDYQLQKNERHIKTILTIMVLLIFCAVIYYLATKNKVQSIQLNQLKSQIHPHFLFNALNSLYSLSINKSDDAPGVVIGISNILRYILYECNGPTVGLGKELDIIKEYVQLENTRRKDKIEVNLNIGPDLDNYLIAPLLLLPLVENAYKHGVNKLVEDAWVSIEAKVINSRCLFKISNNKPIENFGTTAKTKYGNIGLQNIKKRLKILYPNKHQLSITQSDDIFIVAIEVEVKPAINN